MQKMGARLAMLLTGWAGLIPPATFTISAGGLNAGARRERIRQPLAGNLTLCSLQTTTNRLPLLVFPCGHGDSLPIKGYRPRRQLSQSCRNRPAFLEVSRCKRLLTTTGKY